MAKRVIEQKEEKRASMVEWSAVATCKTGGEQIMVMTSARMERGYVVASAVCEKRAVDDAARALDDGQTRKAPSTLYAREIVPWAWEKNVGQAWTTMPRPVSVWQSE
jgi:hypothetical protein